MKTIIQSIRTIVLAIIIGFGVSYVFAAWSEPSCDPNVDPSVCNTSAPVSVGTDTQYKSGTLGVGGSLVGFFQAYGDAYLATDSGTKVGIGTASPFGKLHIQGDGELLTLRTNNQNSTADLMFYNVIGAAAGSYEWDLSYRGRNESDKLYLYRGLTGGDSAVVQSWDKNGNVGIGTASPGSKLHIESSGTTEARIVGTTAQIKLEDTDNGDIYWLHNNGDRLYFLWNGGSGTSWTGDRPFTIYNGNVGIGTASPNAKLDVVGDIRAESNTWGSAIQIGSSFEDESWVECPNGYYITGVKFDYCNNGPHVCYRWYNCRKL